MATEITALPSLSLDSTSLTEIEIGGPTAGDPAGGNDFDGYDRIDITSSTTLDGTLQVQLVNGFVPKVGDEFVFMTSTGAFTDKFDQAQGLLFPTGDRFFDIVVSGGQAKLVVKAVPGAGLLFTPASSAIQDDLGGFLGSYFGGTTFTCTGSVEVADFFSVDGTLTVERHAQNLILADGSATAVPVDVLTLGGANINAFAGANLGTSEAIGMSLSGHDFGIAVARETYGAKRVWTAMNATATTASFSGSSAINLSASNIEVAVNRPAADGTLIDFNPTTFTVKTGASSTITLDLDGNAGSLLEISGSATFTVSDFLSLSGAFVVEKTEGELVMAATGVSAFVGSGSIGAQLSSGKLGAVIATTGTSAGKYALEASGTVALVGVSDLTITGMAAVEINKTGMPISRSIATQNGIVPIEFLTGVDVMRVVGSITLTVANFVSVAGDFTFELERETVGTTTTTQITAGAADIDIFLGANAGTADATGVSITDAYLGLLIQKVTTADAASQPDSQYAMVAGGSAALVGIDGLTLSGSLAARVNRMGTPVDKTIDVQGTPVQVKFDSPTDVTEFSGSAQTLNNRTPRQKKQVL